MPNPAQGPDQWQPSLKTPSPEGVLLCGSNKIEHLHREMKMAMIHCKECGTEISSTANACPKCGAVVPKKKIWPWLVGLPLGVVALIMLWSASIPEYEHKAIAVRNVCEKNFGGSKYECDKAYSNIIKEGQQSTQTPVGRWESEKREAEQKQKFNAEFDRQEQARKKQTNLECIPLLEEQKNKYKKLFASGKYWDAASALRLCADASDDSSLKKMVADAELKSYVADINSSKTTAEEKLRAIEFMQVDSPEQAKKYESMIPTLRAKIKGR